MKVLDRAAALLPMRHEDLDFDDEVRVQLGGVEVERDPDYDRNYRAKPGTVGAVLGALMWPVAEAQVQDGRWEVGWSWSWASVVTEVPDGGVEPRPRRQGGTVSRRDAGLIGRSGEATLDDISLRPAHQRWQADRGFDDLSAGLPPFAGPVPEGWGAITAAGSSQDTTEPLCVPGAYGLVAANQGPSANLGTRVFDLAGDRVDEDRWARLQSAWRVVRPRTGWPWSSTGRDNALAWQLGASGGPDQVAGYGLVIGRGVGRATAGPADRDRPSTGTDFTPQPGGGSDLSGRGGGTVSRREAGRRGGSEVPDPQGQRIVSGTVLAAMSHQAGGLLHVGHLNDKHQIGETADGDPINQGHGNWLAPWIGPAGDAPFDWEDALYPRVTSLPHKAPVHLVYDPDAQHPSPKGNRDGLHRWYCETGIYDPTITDDGDGTEPRLPPDPFGPGGGSGTTPVPEGNQPGGGSVTVGRPELPPEGKPGDLGKLDVFPRRRARIWHDEEGAQPGNYTIREMVSPGLVLRSSTHSGLDARYSQLTDDELAEYDRNAPAVLRLAALPRQTGGELADRTTGDGSSPSRFPGGTIDGHALLTPPEIDPVDLVLGRTLEPSYRDLSTAYWTFGPGVHVGLGTPDVEGGGIETGWDLVEEAGGDLAWDPFTDGSSDSSKSLKVGGGFQSTDMLIEGAGSLFPEIKVTSGARQMGWKYNDDQGSNVWIAGLHGGTDQWKIAKASSFGSDDILIVDDSTAEGGTGRMSVGTGSAPSNALDVQGVAELVDGDVRLRAGANVPNPAFRYLSSSGAQKFVGQFVPSNDQWVLKDVPNNQDIIRTQIGTPPLWQIPFAMARIGNASDAVARADLSVGLAGAGRFFYDQSADKIESYDSGGTRDLTDDWSGTPFREVREGTAPSKATSSMWRKWAASSGPQVTDDAGTDAPSVLHRSNVETLSAGHTITDDDEELHVLDPDGTSREVKLPSIADTNHPLHLWNSGERQDRHLIVAGPNGYRIVTVPGKEGALLLSDRSSDWLAPDRDSYPHAEINVPFGGDPGGEAEFLPVSGERTANTSGTLGPEHQALTPTGRIDTIQWDTASADDSTVLLIHTLSGETLREIRLPKATGRLRLDPPIRRTHLDGHGVAVSFSAGTNPGETLVELGMTVEHDTWGHDYAFGGSAAETGDHLGANKQPNTLLGLGAVQGSDEESRHPAFAGSLRAVTIITDAGDGTTQFEVRINGSADQTITLDADGTAVELVSSPTSVSDGDVVEVVYTSGTAPTETQCFVYIDAPGYVMSFGGEMGTAGEFALAHGDAISPDVSTPDQILPVEPGFVTGLAWSVEQAASPQADIKVLVEEVAVGTVALGTTTGADTSFSGLCEEEEGVAVEFDGGTKPLTSVFNVLIQPSS